MTTRDPAGPLPPAMLDPPDDEDGDPGASSAPGLMRAFMAAVGGQYDRLAADVDQLWQDLFIESCDAWAVPYIGALLGLPADAERLEVAYAIALRRRKGTPAALEDFAYVVTGLTARVVEGWQVTAWAQRLGHPPPPRAASFALSGPGVFRLGTPFERARRSFTPSGRWSPQAATALVWPWQVRTLVDTQAAALPEARRFALHPQGAVAPPYLLPRPVRLATGDGRDAATRTGDEADAPVRATYSVLRALARPGEITFAGSLKVAATHPLADRAGVDTPPLLRISVGGTAVPWDKLRFGGLPPGAAAPFPPSADEVVVDLARGHIQLGAGLSGVPRTTSHRPVAGLLGALASTADIDARARVAVTVNPEAAAAGLPGAVATLDDAFARARQLAAGLDPALSRPGVPDVEIRLATSDRLPAPAVQAFAPNVPNWRIVAPALTTPTVVGALRLDMAGACVALAGFRLAGDLRLGARLSGIELDGVTMDPGAGSVLIDPTAWELAFAARRSILGPVRADLGALALEFSDCVVDGRRDRLQLCAGDSGPAAEMTDAVAAAARFGPAIRADACTFSGPVRVDAASALDSIFADGIDVVQQQEGCLRNCHLGPALTEPTRHPAAYRCDADRVPKFVSTGFEAAGYYCLVLDPDQPLLSAARDGGEVGAYHRSRRGARIRRLRRRIEEFVPLGLRARVEVADWEEA